MKKFYLILLPLLFSLLSQLSAQITSFHNNKGFSVAKSQADYYRVVSKVEEGLWSVQEYTLSGNLLFTGHSTKEDKKTLDGICSWFYSKDDNLQSFAADSQVVKRKCEYKNGKRHGQDISYFDTGEISSNGIFDNGKPVFSKSFYRSGQLQSQINYIDKLPTTRVDYYENGQIKNDIKFLGTGIGRVLEVQSFYEKGNIFREANYSCPIIGNNYQLIKGKCFDEKGKKMDYVPFFKMPEFPGGATNLRSFISNNLIYPHEAIIQHAEGRVYVSFIVNKHGFVENPKIAKSPDDLLNEEAMRVVRLLPKFEPGFSYGEKANVEYTVPISFILQ